MLLDPVGVPRTFWRWTQGAPRARRPWALLFNRFTVINTGALPLRPPLRARMPLCCSMTNEAIQCFGAALLELTS